VWKSNKYYITYSECVPVALVIEHGKIKNPQISNFMKVYPVGAELFDADRQTDRQKDGQMDVK
jgi:hypothetical protein